MGRGAKNKDRSRPGGQTVTDGNGMFLSGYDFESIVVTTFGFTNQFLWQMCTKKLDR